MAIITMEKLENADKDADSLDDFVSGNGKKKVKTRRGIEYLTAPGVEQTLLDNGLKRGFANKAALEKYKPSIEGSLAQDMETKKVWLWDGTKWNDTGASDKDLAVAESKENINSVRSEVFEKFLQKFSLSIPGYFLAMLDSDNLFTDMSIAEDGQIAEFVINRWRNRINEKNGYQFKSNKDFILALIDPHNLMTDLTIAKDGQFAEFVVKRLAGRISQYLDIDVNQTTPKEYTLDSDGNIQALNPNMDQISIWGSSSVSGMHTAFSEMATVFGISDIYLGGKGGENIEQISGRFGAHPANLKFVNGQIPSSGIVEVTVDWYTEPLMRAYTGIVNGVRGTFSYNSDTQTHTFTRATVGEVVIVDPDTAFPFIPDAQSYGDGVVVINAGKNNLTDVRNNSATYVMQYLDEMVRFLKPFNKYVIVMGHFINGKTGVNAKARIMDFNKQAKEKYNDLFFDMHSYVTGSQIWIDTGITPTTEDLEYQANGEKPPSLSSDIQHLNSKSSGAVVAQIKQKLIDLNWYKG